jgi:MscS family membrane protein
MNIAAEFLTRIYFGNTVESYLWFLGILFFGFIFLRFISKVLSRLLFKLFKKFASEVKGEKFVELLLKPIELLLTVSIIYIAINHLNYPLQETLFNRKNSAILYIDIIDKLFLFFVIISFNWIVLRIIDFIALVMAYKASLTESKSDDQLVPFVRELFKILAIIVGVFVVLGMVFEINVLTLITGLGIGGIAIALAAKDSLENLFGSFTIFLDKPFVVGDLVKVDGIEGTIEKVGFRSTQIRSMDKSIITVPNKKMIDNALENLTLRNFRRVKFTLALTYETTPEQLKLITNDINNLINKHQNINEESIAIFEEFGEYSINLMVLYFIEMMEYFDYLKIKEDLNYQITQIIYKHGSNFAFPTRTIIHQSADGNNSITE